MHYLVQNINDVNDEEINNFYPKINENKKNRIDKFKSLKRKKESIIGEMLLSVLLKKYYNLSYEDLSFYYNENGKAFIKNKEIYFNISHSHDYVCTVISNNVCGIDIEKLRSINLNTLNYFTNKEEKEYILSNNEEMIKRYFEIYTLKEAYLKMRGKNISNINDVVDKNTTLITTLNYEDYIITICEKNY